MARLLDEAGVDLILVGDSVGTVIYGDPDTLSVTLDDMIRHTRAVSRAAQQALVVADLPFMTYQVSIEEAVRNSGRLIQEGKAQAVKLEGGIEHRETVSRITRAGIPVMGHIGLTPQSINVLGNYRMHGKSESEQRYLIESARALQEAGAFALVLECITPTLAQEITQSIDIPTIGIGSGPHCDGQVLVSHDLLGMTAGRVPRFVQPTAHLAPHLLEGVAKFIQRTQAPSVGEPTSPHPFP